MIIGIIGLVIGLLVLGASLFYLVKEKQDADARKVYGIMAAVGGVLAVAMLVKLLAF